MRGRTPEQRKRDRERRLAAGEAGAVDAGAPADQPSAVDPGAPPDAPTTDDVDSGSPPAPRSGRRTKGSAPALSDEEVAQRERLAALAAVEWSVRGRLTLALVVAVLLVPFAILEYLPSDRQYSLAAYLIFTLAPVAILPLPLLLGTFVGMPIARVLAREPRSMRVLETLGFAAVIDIVAIVLWGGVLPKSLASYHDGKVVAGGMLVDALVLVGGAYLHGPLSRRLSPQRRFRGR